MIRLVTTVPAWMASLGRAASSTHYLAAILLYLLVVLVPAPLEALSSAQQDTGRIVDSSAWAPELDHAQLFPYLSVLIPAYNEEQRLGRTLQLYQEYLSSHPFWSADKDGDSSNKRCQIVVADDGSTDRTATLVRNWSADASSVPVSCVSLPTNQGKGAALAYGIAHILARQPQSWILTADADASAPLSGLDRMIQRAEEHLGTSLSSSADTVPSRGPSSCSWNIDDMLVVAGYRTYTSASPSRLLFRWGFRIVVKIVVGDLGVRDSQCGFKLFSPAAAAILYQNLYLPSWSHDVEVLYRAQALKMTLLEESIEWQDQPGSKLLASPGGVLAVCAQMFAQILQLRLGYGTGAWEIPRKV